MAYQLIRNGNTEFAVDWDVVERVLRSAANAEVRDAYAQVVRASESRWYNPFSWSLPEIASVEVDWKEVDAKSRLMVQWDGEQLRAVAQRDVRAMALELQHRVALTTRLTNKFLDQMRAVQTENSRAINRAVESYDENIEVAKFVRDTSADGLMVGATMLTGGAATAVLAGGSAFKGYAKFQDTDSVGAAVMEGAGSFAFGYFPMGKTLSGKQEAVLVLVQGAWEVGIGVASGQTLTESIPGGAIKLVGPGADRLVGSKAVTAMFERAPIPFKVWVPQGSTMAVDMASDFMQKTGGEVFKKQAVERFGTPLIAKAIPGATPAPPKAGNPARGRMVGSTTSTNDALLQMAIVNMQKGIGRGL